MGAQSTDRVVPRRSKLRAYLLLARVSNLPTVWTNVLAAVVVSGAASDSLPVSLLALSLFYAGGMFLNDAFDARFDREARPDRPIPNGDVSRREAFGVGFGLLGAGQGLLVWQPFAVPALTWGMALFVAIVFYDFAHKGRSFGPLVMGLCRALVYFVVASGATGDVAAGAGDAALVMWMYVIALTWLAREANLGSAVPWMLAGICLVDAIVILLLADRPDAALLAAAGFPVTLVLQRVVPGT